MLVLVDTPIWSLALRRRDTDLKPRAQRLTASLQDLIRDARAQLVGPIRQKLLPGIRHEASFTKLRAQLRAFDEPRLDVADYEEAARMNNQCRSRGVAGSAVDFLIFAAALPRNWQVFTNGRDFTRH